MGAQSIVGGYELTRGYYACIVTCIMAVAKITLFLLKSIVETENLLVFTLYCV